MSSGASRPPVHPIILGGDAGAYSLARAFDQEYGARSTVLTVVATRNVRYSRILDNVIVPGLDEPETMIAAIRAAAASSSAPAIVVTCVDWYVRALAQYRDRIEDVAAVPYADLDTLDHVMDKEKFSELCHELGVPHPKTVVRRGGDEVGELGLRFPVIAKPADNSAWHHVTFDGKRKVHAVDDQDALAHLLSTAGAAGYREAFIVQELVPGDDAQMRIMTTYSDRQGGVRAAHGGHVLLEEHTPGTLGNPAAILTQALPDVEADARRIVDHLGWRGFANFDIKVDPRDGKGYFFELNPRTGRSNFYLTAAGINPARLWVEDWLQRSAVSADPERDVLYSIVPRRLLLRYLRGDELRRRVRRARLVSPLRNRRERDPRRIAWVRLTELRQWSRFARWYPVAKGAGDGSAGSTSEAQAGASR